MRHVIPPIRIAILLGTGVLALPAPGSAQLSTVASGDRVRVGIMGSQPVEARVMGWRADTLVMARVGEAEPWMLASGRIRTLQRYRALTPREGFRKGAGVGFAVGLFAGAAVGLALYAAGVTHDPEGPPAEQLIRSVLKFTGLGTVAGAAVGGTLGGRTPGWGWVGIRLRTR